MSGCQTSPITLCQPVGYGFLAGTSFSTAIVSSAYAGRVLMHPEERPADIRRKLLASVDGNRQYEGKLTSAGRVNFRKLIEIP